jgi:hypothetical protein
MTKEFRTKASSKPSRSRKCAPGASVAQIGGMNRSGMIIGMWRLNFGQSTLA